MMKKDDCIFCKLANGDIPTNTIYEDEDFRVFLDASPATKGSALHRGNISFFRTQTTKWLPL